MPKDPDPITKPEPKLDAIGAIMTPEQLAQLIAGITAAVAQTAAHGNADTMKDLMAGITGMVDANAKLTDQFRRSQKAENPNYEDVSAYNYDPRCEICRDGGYHPAIDGDLPRKAHAKPALRYDVVMCSGPLRHDWLTIVEIELLNSFDHDVTARRGTWTARVLRDGTKTRLMIDVPFRGIDVKGDLPPLVNILSELLYGEAVVDPTQAIALIKKLEAKVADLEKRIPQGTAA